VALDKQGHVDPPRAEGTSRATKARPFLVCGRRQPRENQGDRSRSRQALIPADPRFELLRNTQELLPPLVRINRNHRSSPFVLCCQACCHGPIRSDQLQHDPPLHPNFRLQRPGGPIAPPPPGRSPAQTAEGWIAIREMCVAFDLRTSVQPHITHCHGGQFWMRIWRERTRSSELIVGHQRAVCSRQIRQSSSPPDHDPWGMCPCKRFVPRPQRLAFQVNYRYIGPTVSRNGRIGFARKARRQAAVSRFLPAHRGDMVPHPPFSGLLERVQSAGGRLTFTRG
jgi:hypothetical protein